MTTFSGFQTAASALRVAQRGLDVTGQNLANATTPGYVRRRVDQISVGQAGLPSVMLPPARTPGGVDASVTRLADPVLDGRWRAEAGLNAAAAGSKTSFDALESTFNEPSDTGLAARLDALWNGFADAANGGGTATVVSSAETVTSWLHEAAGALTGQVEDAKATLANTAAQAQAVAANLADTNAAIIAAHNAGQDTADLQDQRDGYADQLATMLGASTSFGPSGEANVTLAGAALVSGVAAHTLTVGPDAVSLALDGAAVAPPAGTAAAAITTATVTVPHYRAALDTVANALRDQVNAAVTAGYDATGKPGAALFSGSGAAGIAVAVTDPASVAVSSGAPGNTALAGTLSQQGTAAGAPDGLYRDLVSTLGADSARASGLADSRAAATNAIQQSRLSAEGVSVDEETMNLLTYQRNYQAASRVLTTLDEALDTLINHTGRVGL